MRARVTAALVVAVTAAMARAGGSPDDGCARARTLVEKESSHAAGATRAALERGIAELNAALDRGCSDRKAALLTLALGYDTLAYRYAAADSDECRRFEDLRRATHHALGAVAGADPAALMLYAETLDDTASQLAVYRKITRLKPSDPEAHVALAKSLLLADRTDEAMKSFERALSVADADALNRVARTVDELLRERALEEEASAMRAAVERRRAMVGPPSGR
jgi:hypothetical protein